MSTPSPFFEATTTQDISNKDMHQSFTEEKIARQMCYLLYKYGFMRGVLDSRIQAQVLSGNPEKIKYNIHHICPTSMHGSNHFSNLTLMDIKLHDFIHKSFLSAGSIETIKQMQKNQPDISYDKITPLYPPIATLQNSFLITIFYTTKALISLGLENKLDYVKSFFYSHNRGRYDFASSKFDNLIKRLRDTKDVPWAEKEQRTEPIKNHFLPVYLSSEQSNMQRLRKNWLRIISHMTSQDITACRLIRTHIRPIAIIQKGLPEMVCQYNQKQQQRA